MFALALGLIHRHKYCLQWFRAKLLDNINVRNGFGLNSFTKIMFALALGFLLQGCRAARLQGCRAARLQGRLVDWLVGSQLKPSVSTAARRYIGIYKK